MELVVAGLVFAGFILGRYFLPSCPDETPADHAAESGGREDDAEGEDGRHEA